MSEAKHTKGLWIHDKMFPTSIWANDVWIASTNVESVSSMEEREANARLIASAPDLLDACEAARLTYRALARNHKMIIEAMQAKGWLSNWLTQEIEKAQKVDAAIRRAKEGK